MRRRFPIAPLIGAVIAALGVTAAIGITPSQALPPTPAPGRICVAVVVETGTTPSASSSSSSCVSVPAGASGANVLWARALQLGKPKPRYNSDGLLCAIDGFPATGCGEPSPFGGYRYWSYWHRKNSEDWTYSVTPAGWYTINGSHPIEGWVWIDGGPLGSLRPPNTGYLNICAPTFPTMPTSVPVHSTPDYPTLPAGGRATGS